MIRFIQWILASIALFSLLYAIAINPQDVPLHYLPVTEPHTVPLYAVILGAFIAGYAISFLYQLLSQCDRLLRPKSKPPAIKDKS